MTNLSEDSQPLREQSNSCLASASHSIHKSNTVLHLTILIKNMAFYREIRVLVEERRGVSQ